MGDGLRGLALIARRQAELQRSAALLDEALELESQVRWPVGVGESLEAIAGLSGELGRVELAGRLFGAAHALREAGGYARAAPRQEQYEEDVKTVTAALGARRFQLLHAQGAALSLEDAVALARKGRGKNVRPTVGWDSLTRAESDIVDLVVQGLSTAQVAERLFVSPHTVTRHLTHIFAKLEIRSRAQLMARAVQRTN
jgi:DNA-binding CsgD family transcriptional regulator